MDDLQNLWYKLTVPRASDVDEARREYMTRVILALASVLVLIASMLFILGWFMGVFDAVALAVAVTALVLFGSGLWLVQRGYWRAVSYVPPAAVYVIGLMSNYRDGLGSGAMLYYAAAILLTVMLQGVRIQWVMVALSLGTYLGLGLAHAQGHLQPRTIPESAPAEWFLDVIVNLVGIACLLWFLVNQFRQALAQSRALATELTAHKANLEEQVEARTTELQQSYQEQERLHGQILEAQRQMIRELSTPVIPVLDAPDGSGGVIVMPLVGHIDAQRAKDVMRALLAGIREQRARVVILDITGVPVVDSGVAMHLNRTIQAARLKGAQTIVTGISDAVAEAVVDLGIDWSELDTLSDLQTGLVMALDNLGVKLIQA